LAEAEPDRQHVGRVRKLDSGEPYAESSDHENEQEDGKPE
jgi:hypothetical protein